MAPIIKILTWALLFLGGIPGGSSGCQNVKQPVCYNGNACAPNYQTCCRMENKRVCVNRPIRVPNYEKVTVPGQPTYKRVCDNKEVERVRYEQETVTEKNPTTSNRCVRKTIPKTHEYTKKEFEVESKTDKGTVDIQVQECNIGNELVSSIEKKRLRKGIRNFLIL